LSPRCLAVLLLLDSTLAARADRETEITPVILPPTPELRQRAESGDARAPFKLAEHLWPAHPGDPEPLYWLVAAACQGDPVAQTSLGALYDAGDGVTADRLEAYLVG
jgi:TPR repeat protein